jgi:hypothetical protein
LETQSTKTYAATWSSSRTTALNSTMSHSVSHRLLTDSHHACNMGWTQPPILFKFPSILKLILIL